MAKESVLGMLKRPVQPKSIEVPTATDPNASLYWIIKEAKDEARRVAEERIAAAEEKSEAAEMAALERINAAVSELAAERQRNDGLMKSQQSLVERVNSFEQSVTTSLQGITEALSSIMTTPRNDVGQMSEIMRKIAGIEATLTRSTKPPSIKMPEFPELTVDIVSRDMNRDIKQLNLKPRT